MYILGIETSCDDTGAAVLKDNQMVANVLSSQDSIHAKFGGVVPELASRNHLQAIHPVVESALFQAEIELTDVGLIAVTQGPGLTGSLLVGFSYAKALGSVTGIPVVGVDHMAGHILSVFLEDTDLTFPYLALIVSGGTSSIFIARSMTDFECLGRTRDDAAGEAFDKVAKLLGLPYPGGPHVSKLAEEGDPAFIKFPRAWLEEGSYDFSFSGLKTAVLNHVNKEKMIGHELDLPTICASFQEAVVDVLVTKSIAAAKAHNIPNMVLGGGVSANKRLRDQFGKKSAENNISFYAPKPIYCTDNGAMIGFAGSHFFKEYGSLTPEDDVYSRSSLG